MIFDYSKLCGKIKEVFGVQGAFAKAVHMSERSVSNKLNNKALWKQDQILTACSVLSIPVEDINIYFFTVKVQKNELKTA